MITLLYNTNPFQHASPDLDFSARAWSIRECEGGIISSCWLGRDEMFHWEYLGFWSLSA